MRKRLISFQEIMGILFGFCLIGYPLKGQDQPDLPTLNFKTLTKENGLTDNCNAFISKDPNGFIWISSLDGLYRFDGVTLKPYYPRKEDPNSLRHNIVTGPCFFGPENDIWFSVYSGIQKLNRTTGRFEFIQARQGSLTADYYAFHLDREQNLWFSAGDQDSSYLIRYNIVTRDETVILDTFFVKRCSVQEDDDGRVARIIGSSMVQPGVEILDFAPDSPYPKRRRYLSSPSEIRVRGHFALNDNLVWLATNAGLLSLDPETGKTSAPVNEYRGDPLGGAWSIAPIPGSGTAFLSTGSSGILLFDIRNGDLLGAYQHQLENPLSLRLNWTNELFIDPEDNLWISAYDFGLMYTNLKKVKFKTILGNRKKDGQYPWVSSLSPDKAENMWVVKDGVLFKIGKDNRPVVWENGKKGPFEQVSFIYTDRNQNLWVLIDKTAWRFNPNLRLFEPIWDAPEPMKLIFQLNNNHYLVALQSDLWLYSDDFAPKRVLLDNREDLKDISYIFQSSDGKVFLSQNGDRLLVTRADQPGNLSSIHLIEGVGFCYSIYEDDHQKYWLATWQNIVTLDQNDLKRPMPVHWAPPGVYYQIQPDKHGRLWVSGSQGLFFLDPEKKKSHPFHSADGALSLGYLPTASAVSGDGRLWFGGNGGLNVFHPDSVKMIRHLPLLQITGLEINESPLETIQDFQIHNTLELLHFQNTIEIHFAGLEFSDPTAIRYKYRIKEIETGWVDGGHSGYARYPDLNPGHYTFEALASNSDGVWTEEKNALRFTFYIQPAWYQRTGIQIAGGLLVVFLLGLWYLRFTKRKLEARKQKELQEFKTQFFANITHEFRTPLTLIKSPLADALQKDAGLDKESIRMVMQNVARLEKYVNQVLDLNKLEAGQLTPQFGRGDLVLFLNDYVQGFQPVAVHRKIGLAFQPAFQGLVMDIAPEFLDHIVGNLLSNAMKFTPPGGHVAVTLDPVNQESGEEWVRIKVADSGQGIPPENLEKIFDRFFQDKSKAHRGAGTGIGLHFTRQLVELLGGSIHATNLPGGGAQFIFDLPVKKSEALPEIKPGADPAPQLPASAVERNAPVVLIVEDDAPMANYIRQILAGRYDCHVASDGVEGEEKALELLPDLIVSDVMMPRLDGFELLQRLRENEETLSIPIIILTAKSSIETRLNALQSAADAYLPKPFNPAELLAQTDNLILQRQRLKAYYKKLISGDPPGEVPHNRLPKDELFLEKISAYIQSRLLENFSVEEIAHYMLMSTSSLYSKCKSLLGYAPKELIEQIRIKEAKRLLETTDQSVNEISMAVGYSASNYFIKVFKKYTGQTPAQYRRK